MSVYSSIEVKDKNLLAAVQDFLGRLLEKGSVDALLVPWHLPQAPHIMPTLVTDPETLDRADPLSPCFPLNAARMASRLTKRHSGKTLGLVMRPCEIRAYVELVKLKQGDLEDVLLIGVDCPGALTNSDFRAFAADSPDTATRRFCDAVLGSRQQAPEGMELASACRVCEHPVAENADLCVQLYGNDHTAQIGVTAQTPKGEAVLQETGPTAGTEPSGRGQAVAALVKSRITRRDEMFEQVAARTGTIEKLTRYLSGCVNCYNCRVACPVCYCKECVFVTDVFDHDPFQYVQWASQQGKLKMPSDTAFFHLTRMAHIGLTCVGCGQCANACPNDIPLADLFKTIAFKAQNAFDYQAGRSVDEPIPLSVFESKEYEEVVGIASTAS